MFSKTNISRPSTSGKEIRLLFSIPDKRISLLNSSCIRERCRTEQKALSFVTSKSKAKMTLHLTSYPNKHILYFDNFFRNFQSSFRPEQFFFSHILQYFRSILKIKKQIQRKGHVKLLHQLLAQHLKMSPRF